VILFGWLTTCWAVGWTTSRLDSISSGMSPAHWTQRWCLGVFNLLIACCNERTVAAMGRGFTGMASSQSAHISQQHVSCVCCPCCCVQSHGLSSLRGTQDLAQLPDMKELQKLAGRDDVHVLLQATNAPIQGTSADVLKAALIQLHDKLAGPPHHCRLLLTVSAWNEGGSGPVGGGGQ
jgi:hypothetical protein